MKPSEALRKARKLIEKPENWKKKLYGFNPLSPQCGCAVGAIAHAVGSGYLGYNKAYQLLLADAQRYGFKTIEHANDDPKTTHKQVLRAFTRAIKAAEAAGE